MSGIQFGNPARWGVEVSSSFCSKNSLVYASICLGPLLRNIISADERSTSQGQKKTGA